jgi:hypothetical protein
MRLVAGHAAAPVGAEILEEGVPGVDRAVRVERARLPVGVGKALQIWGFLVRGRGRADDEQNQASNGSFQHMSFPFTF